MTAKHWAVLLLFVPGLFAAAEAVSFHATNRNNGSMVSSGEHREYILYVPRSYDPSKPAPLVISMHGAGGWPKQQMDLSRWNDLAEREGFIVVYPSAFDGPGPRIWRADVGPGLMKDVRFIEDLVEKLESTYNVDPQRIYANGFSNGGGMSFVLSCALAGRVAAIGMVGAAQGLPFSWCRDRQPVPMIAFHGTDDPDAPYRGGMSWMAPNPFPDVEKWAESWSRRNRCSGPVLETEAAPDVVRREYTRCAEDASVVLYTIRGGGHTWPGGGPLPEYFVGRTTNSVDATGEMWTFFRAHPRRPATSVRPE